jgi:hypothetical protein
MTDLRVEHFEVAPGAQGPGYAVPSPPPPPPPPSPGAQPAQRRSRSLLFAAAVAAALIAGVAVGVPLGLLSRGSGSSPSSTTSPSPSAASAAAVQARALYQRAIAAANGSAGFHYVAVSRSSSATQRIEGDAGQDSGTQAITMGSTYGPEQFSLVLVSGTVYFQGNSPSLQDQLGVPAANAPGLAGKWISVVTGDGPYGIVAPGITVGDQVQETGLVPTSTTQNSTGSRILGTVPAQQGATGPAHLDVASGTALPISYVATVTDGGATITSTTTFSGWGMAPSTTTPAGAIAWSTLGASQPPGGYGSGGNTSQTPQA